MSSKKIFSNLSISVNEKIQGYIEMPVSKTKLPTTIICGNSDGKTALITGGVHNAEYVRINAIIHLMNQIKPEQINGTIILIPVVNVSGFEKRTVIVSPQDGKNLNRVFPGSPNGTYTEKLAYDIENILLKQVDYVIDVHNGERYV